MLGVFNLVIFYYKIFFSRFLKQVLQPALNPNVTSGQFHCIKCYQAFAGETYLAKPFIQMNNFFSYFQAFLHAQHAENRCLWTALEFGVCFASIYVQISVCLA